MLNFSCLEIKMLNVNVYIKIQHINPQTSPKPILEVSSLRSV